MNELSLTADQQVQEPAHDLTPIASTDRFPNQASWRDRVRSFMEQPAIKRALPLLGLLAVVVLAGTLWLALREPPQRDLFRSLPETDKAAVAEALQQSNIGFNIDEATGALTVSEADYHQAKLSLAAQGLPKSAPDGDSLISAMPMGASRAVENEKLRSAREMDLARTIEAMDNVISACAIPSIMSGAAIASITRPNISVAGKPTANRFIDGADFASNPMMICTSSRADPTGNAIASPATNNEPPKWANLKAASADNRPLPGGRNS